MEIRDRGQGRRRRRGRGGLEGMRESRLQEIISEQRRSWCRISISHHVRWEGIFQGSVYQKRLHSSPSSSLQPKNLKFRPRQAPSSPMTEWASILNKVQAMCS
nr:uncharacterized protein LOC112283960 isoform X1 [Physcomitrium patens]|eukprot:XP_024379157.1 uncharacterized protein LOC112283960 isoform X1 [Physcomitrella patens]